MEIVLTGGSLRMALMFERPMLFSREPLPYMVTLLSGFELHTPAGTLEVPQIGRKLIAYLALQHRMVPRATVAGVIWPESTQDKAQASLRSTLWRVRRACDELIESSHDCLSLAPAVAVDVDTLLDASRSSGANRPQPATPLQDIPHSWFGCELLPDWYDDWVVLERERFRLAMLHALDRLAEISRLAGDHRQAVEYAMLAIRLEPLRESSHRQLVDCHIAQGNLSEAARQYRYYRDLVRLELGVDPSPLMIEIIRRCGLDPDRL